MIVETGVSFAKLELFVESRCKTIIMDPRWKWLVMAKIGLQLQGSLYYE